MADLRDKSSAQRKMEFSEQIWLSYFNYFLYSRGIITEAERNKMQNLINSRKPSPSKE